MIIFSVSIVISQNNLNQVHPKAQWLKKNNKWWYESKKTKNSYSWYRSGKLKHRMVNQGDYLIHEVFYENGNYLLRRQFVRAQAMIKDYPNPESYLSIGKFVYYYMNGKKRHEYCTTVKKLSYSDESSHHCGIEKKYNKHGKVIKVIYNKLKCETPCKLMKIKSDIIE